MMLFWALFQVGVFCNVVVSGHSLPVATIEDALLQNLNDNRLDLNRVAAPCDVTPTNLANCLNAAKTSGLPNYFTDKFSANTLKDYKIRVGPDNNRASPLIQYPMYKYHTNQASITDYVEMVILNGDIPDGSDPTDSAKTNVLNALKKEGILPQATPNLQGANYDGGHILRKSFGGPGQPYNIFPQNASINRGVWNTLEGQLKDLIKKYNRAILEYYVTYPNGKIYPSRISVMARFFDGTTFKLYKNFMVDNPKYPTVSSSLIKKSTGDMCICETTGFFA